MHDCMRMRSRVTFRILGSGLQATCLATKKSFHAAKFDVKVEERPMNLANKLGFLKRIFIDYSRFKSLYFTGVVIVIN